MHNERMHRLIGRILSGEASTLEKRQLNEWMDESEEHRDIYHTIKEAWEESRFSYRYPRQNEVFNQIRQNIHLHDSIPEERNSNIRRSLAWYRYAAIISFFIAATVVVFWLVQQNQRAAVKYEPALVTKSIPKGSKLKLYLPDGSIVWLNADSKLVYPESFEQGQRIVQLHGEAFFEVVRDTLRPFIVQTGNLSIRVLGTSFNIRALPQYNDIKVAVATGKVSVGEQSANSETGKVLLEPSQMAVYHKVKKNLEIQPCNIEELTSWKDGVIIFNEASIEQIVEELERWYGVEFILDSDLKTGQSINARFDNQTLEYLLDGLSYMSDIKYRIEDKKVYLLNN
jgi:ferric-dicitrate binding protein FerR (iron transport regulator)